jgi:anti-sigma regulatory factor (Ser/Thr protein kinase)
MARENGVALYLDADDAPVMVTDRILCYRILTNLVHNALKFTDEGHVRVTVTESVPGVQFSVKDTGIGIEESFLPHLFEPFKQESNGRTRTHDGTGLGLAITKRMVDLLSGHITVTSSKSEGTTITVDLSPSLPYEGGPVLTTGYPSRPELDDPLPEQVAHVASLPDGHGDQKSGSSAHGQISANPDASGPPEEKSSTGPGPTDGRRIDESLT